MKIAYTKEWKSFDEQLDQLISRGLIVTDRMKALECLERIGYYRLSGYWYAFRERTEVVWLADGAKKPKKIKMDKLALDEFKPNATYQQAVDLYVFDKQLSMLVMDALERIEIALRVDISHTLANIDKFAYLKADCFHEKFSKELDPKTGLTKHHEWLSKHAQLITRSKEEFVKHNKEKYGLPLAIWVACEVWDFGSMSTLYSGMCEEAQDSISTQYGISNGRTFATWLRSLNYLRNVCAHHSRLWNRNIVEQPKLPEAEELVWVEAFELDTHARSRCFLQLCMIKQLLKVIHPNSSWASRVEQHLQVFPNLEHLRLNLYGMGAADRWAEIWNGI